VLITLGRGGVPSPVCASRKHLPPTSLPSRTTESSGRSPARHRWRRVRQYVDAGQPGDASRARCAAVWASVEVDDGFR